MGQGDGGRLLALRAIMDGRGVDVAVLTSAAAIAWHGGGDGAALVVTAGCRVAVDRGGDGLWPAVARIAGTGRVVGYEGGGMTAPGRAALDAALMPRRAVDISADVLRGIGGSLAG
ncbi:hypothetical protein [Paracoccus luteus]|uniref:hypothetical protein n=1 Tax=Paracoccus luteus TaxID=2508543 RepID=UPI0010705502|nr:hypothetical protein [Paracoccus luteus]